ncbi:MAG: hypothetical protein IJO48_02625 [Clostridia bacterium]|nr:hypothetical protein [Clostridia bacterium]
MELFAGFDGGGTKTLCVLADENGNILGVGKGGPSNYLFCGKELAAQSVRDSIEQAFSKAGAAMRPLRSAYMCSAATEIYCGESHVPFFSTCIDTQQLTCNSDIVPVWYGAVQGAPAIMTISGTGAATYACWDDKYAKASGWGALMGDEGSGYDIGHKAVQIATRIYDKRESDNEFLEAICKHYEVETPRGLHRVFRMGDQRSLVASATVPVFELYQKGNETAKKLLEYAANEIVLAVKTAGREAGFTAPVPLIVSGSLLHPERCLYGLVEECIAKNCDCVSEMMPAPMHPAVAAAALAMSEAGRKEQSMILLEKGKLLDL